MRQYAVQTHGLSNDVTEAIRKRVEAVGGGVLYADVTYHGDGPVHAVEVKLFGTSHDVLKVLGADAALSGGTE